MPASEFSQPLCFSDVRSVDPLQQAPKNGIDLRLRFSIAFKLGVEAFAISRLPGLKLTAFIHPHSGVLSWAASDVPAANIAVDRLPLPRACCIESGKDGFNRSGAEEVVRPSFVWHLSGPSGQLFRRFGSNRVTAPQARPQEWPASG